MKLTSPAVAIAWEIWRQHRIGLSGVMAGILSGSIAGRMLGPNHPWKPLVESTAYTALGFMLILVFGAFHFTEGQRKAGFGSFPVRLFKLPVSTPHLVALPMIYGAAVVALVYLSVALLVFRPLGTTLPILWPCVYLVFGLVQFQTTLWSFPENRYAKLLCLSVSATFILMAWMFFLPHVVEGTLSDWGYEGDPGVFMRYLLATVSLLTPAAYGFGVHRIRQQRHRPPRRGRFGIQVYLDWIGRVFHRTQPFRSTWHAILWQEWRGTGWILPLCVVVILAMVCIPTALSGPVGARGTRAVLLGLGCCPLLLALILGRGFAKPDFWKPGLGVAPFQAIRPVPPGMWVLSKLTVAMGSAVVAWLIVLATAILWMIYQGDFQAFDEPLEAIRFFYTSPEQVGLVGLGLATAILLTWRFLVGGLATGLSGKRGWFYLQNSFTVILLAGGLTYLITSDPDTDAPSRLHRFWPFVAHLPTILAVTVIAKMIAAASLWERVHRQQFLSSQLIAMYLAAWSVATAVPAALVAIACENTAWLKLSLWLVCLLWVPLAGPALAILSLASNRTRS